MLFFEKLIDKRIAEYQSDLLAVHYAEVESMYRQTRGWRHDYRNHIQVLKGYAEQGDLEALNRYLNELAVDLNTVDTALKTGNRMTDVILNSKISLARSSFICPLLIPPP
ncbi:MAG: Spo0B domain-containing protein [Blautia sp.]|nr:Spo0B domain-containing protein [Blautia sp.]